MNLAPHRKFQLLLLGFAILALVGSVVAQQSPPQQRDQKAPANPLVRVLQVKGILTEEEAAMIAGASSPAESEQRLAKLLLSKGIISQADYEQTVGASMVMASSNGTTGARMVPAVLREPIYKPTNADAQRGGRPLSKMADILPGGAETTTDVAFGTILPAAAVPEPAPAPPLIPAFAPIRVLPVGLMTRESVKPVISAGPIHIQPYGFLKMNVIEDSSNPVSGDAPLSGMLVPNTGPNPAPQFHLNARASRFGTNFEWLDPSQKLVVTGKLEADFEGNYTAVFNRGVSTMRSSTLGLRLAFGRLDYHVSDQGGVFALFGQDWTPFCSSTLPSSNETTLLGVEFGSCYERAMQARFGANYDFGGSRHFQIQPEFAIVHPALASNPGGFFEATCTTPTCSNVASTVAIPGLVNQLFYGERAGADANKPELQARVALQFQLDNAPGVAPAQLIASGMIGRGEYIVASTAVPAAFQAAFPGGVAPTFRTFGYSAEAQLPTRWFTLQGKWWAGEALRFYFVNNLLNTFNPTAAFLAANPLGVTALASDIDAAVNVAFGCSVALVGGVCPAANASVLPPSPIRGVGGFADLGIPLSRIFGANPKGRNAGWTLDLGYNIDQSKARDLRSNSATFNPVTGVTSWNGVRYKNDWGRATLNYKINSWVLIGFEAGYYRTRALPGSTGGLPLIINGLPVRSWHDRHEQVSTIFFF